MAKISYLSRQALVVVDNVFCGSGADFGAKNVSGFTRVSGIASVIGSVSIRMRSAINQAGPFITSSVWVANSGPTQFDAPNYGSYLSIDVTAAASQAACSFAIYGEPLR